MYTAPSAGFSPQNIAYFVHVSTYLNKISIIFMGKNR